MRALVISVFFFCLFLSGCGSRATPSDLAGLQPGMGCRDLEDYLKDHGVSLKKRRDEKYEFRLKGPLWKKASAHCVARLDRLEFHSSSLGFAGERVYIEFETALMNVFRDEKIVYEEGLRTVSFSNGVKLRQFVEKGSGTVGRFSLSVEGSGRDSEVWKKVFPLLVEAENGK